MLNKEKIYTFLIYCLSTTSGETSPSGENIEGFQSAPLAAITEEAPYAKPCQIENKYEKWVATC